MNRILTLTSDYPSSVSDIRASASYSAWGSICFIVSSATPTTMRIDTPLRPIWIPQMIPAMAGRIAIETEEHRTGEGDAVEDVLQVPGRPPGTDTGDEPTLPLDHLGLAGSGRTGWPCRSR